MVKKVIDWIKRNKLTTVLIVVILLLVVRRPIIPSLFSSNTMYDTAMEFGGGFDSLGAPVTTSLSRSKSYAPILQEQAAPRPDITDRKVITDANISLQVKDVYGTVEKIKDKIATLKGYMVNTNISNRSEIVSGYITVRVPSGTLDETMEYFRGLAVKVVSENVSGSDITDQYTDIQERLNRLESTKARFESFMDSAETIEEILKVQREILNLQNEIDRYRGQQIYMDGASSTTLITVNLSTDELGVPYLPEQAWRPEVIFKQAYRSLLLNLIKIGNASIFFVVAYLPFILVGLFIYKGVKRFLNKRKAEKA